MDSNKEMILGEIKLLPCGARNKNHKCVKCQQCGNLFYKTLSNIRRRPANYCSILCSNKALSAKNTLDNPSRLRKNRYPKTECGLCGYNKYPDILEFHHKDRDRNNNTKENIIVLCPNCHMEEHFIAGDGPWSNIGKLNND